MKTYESLNIAISLLPFLSLPCTQPLLQFTKIIKLIFFAFAFFFQVLSREGLEAMHKKQAEVEENNQNPWTFKRIAQGNMLGIRKVLSPFDLRNHGRFTGKFHLPGRV